MGLLVRRGAGIDHVALALLSFVLDGVEQEVVEFLEHRQHRLARDRGPAAEADRDLVLGDQLARLFGEQRPVGGGIDDDRLERPAENAALGVLLGDQHQHDVLQGRLADRHRARQRMQDADLDRLGRRQRVDRPTRTPAPAAAPETWSIRRRERAGNLIEDMRTPAYRSTETTPALRRAAFRHQNCKGRTEQKDSSCSCRDLAFAGQRIFRKAEGTPQNNAIDRGARKLYCRGTMTRHSRAAAIRRITDAAREARNVRILA